MKKQVCKDCYYAGFNKCDHVDETEYLKQGENGKKLKESISQLKTKVMESRNVDLHESVIVYALRYAFKRRTGALLQIVEYLKPIAKNLQEQTKKDILREMDNERRLKSDCVDFVWDELEELLTKKQEVMEKESKAEHFLKGLSEHSEIFDLNISPEYTERQLLLFAEMYHKHEQNRKAAMLNPPNLDDVMDNQKDFLTWYTTGNNKHYVGDKLIEAYKKEVLNQ